MSPSKRSSGEGPRRRRRSQSRSEQRANGETGPSATGDVLAPSDREFEHTHFIARKDPALRRRAESRSLLRAQWREMMHPVAFPAPSNSRTRAKAEVTTMIMNMSRDLMTDGSKCVDARIVNGLLLSGTRAHALHPRLVLTACASNHARTCTDQQSSHHLVPNPPTLTHTPTPTPTHPTTPKRPRAGSLPVVSTIIECGSLGSAERALSNTLRTPRASGSAFVRHGFDSRQETTFKPVPISSSMLSPPV